MTTVGFIGVGMIGMPMAKNILRGGFALNAYDLDASRVALVARIRDGIPPRSYLPGADRVLARGKRYLIDSFPKRNTTAAMRRSSDVCNAYTSNSSFNPHQNTG